MTVLVVGANGQIGKHLINLLKESPEQRPGRVYGGPVETKPPHVYQRGGNVVYQSLS